MSEKHTIAQRLREQCSKLRTKPTPLAELIPLMQQAADALEASPAPCAMPVGPSDEELDAALLDLHFCAMDHDSTAYGLPIHITEYRDLMRARLRALLSTHPLQDKTQPGNEKE